ncbi:MFS transporter [Calidifontibacter terrae]
MTTSAGQQWFAVGTMRRYVASYGLDALADGLFFVLLGWVAAHSTDRLAAIAVIGVASVLKLAVLVLGGGAVGDRWGSGRVVVWTLAVRVLVLVVLATSLFGSWPTAVLVAVAAAYGVVDGVHEPAMEALSTEAPGAPEVQRGLQGALSALREVGLLASGPLAGAVIVWQSSGWVALVIAALLAVGLVLLVGLRRSVQGDPETELAQGSLWSSARSGWRDAWRVPALRRILILFFAANVVLTPPIVAGVPLLARLHHWSALEFGVVDGGYAAGALVGALTIARFGDRVQRPMRAALFSLIPTAAALAILGWPSSWVAAAVVCVVAGFSTGFGPAVLGGTLKERTPAGLQGRVQAVRSTAVVAGGPTGFVLFAAVVGLAGVPWALTVLAAVLVLVLAGLSITE